MAELDTPTSKAPRAVRVLSSRFPRRIVLMGCMVAVFGAGFILFGKPKGAGAPVQGGAPAGAGAKPAGGGGAPATPVLAAEATTREMTQTLEVNGTLATDGEMQVAHRLTGKVLAVYVKEGDRVKRGQPIALVGMRELPGEIQRAKADLAAAEAKLSLTRNQASYKDASAAAEYERAKANLEAARSRLQQAKTNAQLVDVETRAAVRTAEANLAVAKERLAIARDSTRRQELRQAQLAVEQANAQVVQARVDMDNARQVWERRQTLFKQDAIAREEVDEAERRYKATQSIVKVAEASVSVAQQKLELAKEGSRPEEVRVAEQQVQAAQQALEQARSDERKRKVAEDEIAAAQAAVGQAEAMLRSTEAGLVQPKISQDEIAAVKAEIAQRKADLSVLMTRQADLVVKAPVDGVVYKRMVNVGQFMTPSAPLITLHAMDKVYFEAQVPELEISLLKPGMAAQVTVDALPGRKFRGVVREIIPVADPTSRNFRVRIAVLRGNAELPANGYARAKVFVGKRQGAVVIAKSSIQSEAGDKFVWLIAGDGESMKAERRPIRVGLVDDHYAEVLDGLKAGDRVVAAGSPAIIEGTPVSITGTDAAMQ